MLNVLYMTEVNEASYKTSDEAIFDTTVKMNR
jgi:hypothetical protein